MVELVVDTSLLNGTQLKADVAVARYPDSNEVQFITTSAASPLGGVFSLVYHPVAGTGTGTGTGTGGGGGATANLTYDVSAGDMKFAIESAMPALGSVDVTRYTLADGVRNEFQWVVFLTQRAGDVERLEAITEYLTGDQAAVEIKEADGTTDALRGTFALSYANCSQFAAYTCTTGPIAYDASAAELAAALAELTLIPGRVDVEKEYTQFDGSSRWIITFVDGGDVDALVPDIRALSGADLNFTVLEEVKGRACVIRMILFTHSRGCVCVRACAQY